MPLLISSRLPSSVATSSSATTYNNNINHSRSYQINVASLPKYFNVPFAIQHGYFRCIRYLLQLNYDPNERDGQLRTPLILCAYIENSRWSLSLAQNLLEKGAKIALEDHARRNAMHHACALQRIHLVQLYLSCLDFNIEAKDCEGNTCLHYAAITGNCEITELLMRAAEKIGLRLDQYVNREGCSAAVLALKYGHIECANQITHRDWDEFFVIPRPLSIYEIPSTTEDNQNRTTVMPSNKRNNIPYAHDSLKQNERLPSTLSFGLLKIIFNESDTGYSTRLARLCKQDKQSRHQQHVKPNKHEALQTSTVTTNKHNKTKSTLVDNNHYCSTEAVVNETLSPTITKEHRPSIDSNRSLNNCSRSSARLKLLMQQQQSLNKSNLKDNSSSFIQKTISRTQFSNDDIDQTKSNSSKNDFEENKSKIHTPTMYRQTSNSALNHSENYVTRKISKLQRPTTAHIHKQALGNSFATSAKVKPTHNHSASTNKNSLLMDPNDSASYILNQHHSTVGTKSAAYSQTIYAGCPVSAVARHPIQRSNDASYSIREAKRTTSRYNKPEELFGVRPEELFAPEQHQPKLLDQRSITKSTENTLLKRIRLQKQQYIWQQDVSKIIELYNIHHSTNYRKSAVAPEQASAATQADTTTDLTSSGRSRRMSITKTPATILKPPTYLKQSTLVQLNIARRNSVTRSSIKSTNQ